MKWVELMKKILFILILFFVLPQTVRADNGDREKQLMEEFRLGVEEQINSIDTQEWENFIDQLPAESKAVMGNSGIRDLIRNLVTGKFSFDIKKIFQEIGDYFFKEILANLDIMAKIVVLAVICGILNNLRGAFENESIGEISHFVCYLLIVILIVQSFSLLLANGRETIQSMVTFMQLLFPTLLTLLVAMGGFASSAIFQPAIALLVSIVSTFLRDILLPLILFSAILVVINNLSEKIQLSKLAGLVRGACAWILGSLFTIFLAVLTIQGVTAASFDGISIRTAKYAIDTFIPIVGGMFSDTVDTIIGCSLLVKNAVGIIGLVVLACICLFPALKILAMVFIYRLSAALLEPIADSKVVNCLNEIANVLIILFVTVVSVGIMFFISVTLLICAGNITVMMR